RFLHGPPGDGMCHHGATVVNSIPSPPVGGTLVAWVAENSEGWCQEVQNLVLSLRRFGGELSAAPFVACFVEGVEPRFASGLAALDAGGRGGDRVPARTPRR